MLSLRSSNGDVDIYSSDQRLSSDEARRLVVRPTFFDAPSIEGLREVSWGADTFLVYSPDAVLSRVLRPICGFKWGYQLRDGVVFLDPLSVAEAGDWERNLPDLRERFSSWIFEEGVGRVR